MSFRSCRAQPNIRGPSRRLAWDATLRHFSLCKQVEKTSCLKISIRRLQINQCETLPEFACYLYDDLNLDFDKNRCAILYDLYARFCKGYYGGYEYLESSLIFTTFLRNSPFVIIDCSRQNESIKSGTVNVRLDFECKENVPANTTAYCLIILDRMVQYNPLINIVRKIT